MTVYLESKKSILNDRVKKGLGEKQLKLEAENRQLAADISKMQAGTYETFVNGTTVFAKGLKSLQEDKISADVSGINESFSLEQFDKMVKAVQKRQGKNITAEQLASWSN